MLLILLIFGVTEKAKRLTETGYIFLSRKYGFEEDRRHLAGVLTTGRYMRNLWLRQEMTNDKDGRGKRCETEVK